MLMKINLNKNENKPHHRLLESTIFVFLGLILTLLVLSRCSPITTSLSKYGYVNKAPSEPVNPKSDTPKTAVQKSENTVNTRYVFASMDKEQDEVEKMANKKMANKAESNSKNNSIKRNAFYSQNSNEDGFTEIKETGHTKVELPLYDRAREELIGIEIEFGGLKGKDLFASYETLKGTKADLYFDLDKSVSDEIKGSPQKFIKHIAEQYSAPDRNWTSNFQAIIEPGTSHTHLLCVFLCENSRTKELAELNLELEKNDNIPEARRSELEHLRDNKRKEAASFNLLEQVIQSNVEFIKVTYSFKKVVVE